MGVWVCGCVWVCGGVGVWVCGCVGVWGWCYRWIGRETASGAVCWRGHKARSLPTLLHQVYMNKWPAHSQHTEYISFLRGLPGFDACGNMDLAHLYYSATIRPSKVGAGLGPSLTPDPSIIGSGSGGGNAVTTCCPSHLLPPGTQALPPSPHTLFLATVGLRFVEAHPFPLPPPPLLRFCLGVTAGLRGGKGGSALRLPVRAVQGRCHRPQVLCGQQGETHGATICSPQAAFPAPAPTAPTPITHASTPTRALCATHSCCKTPRQSALEPQNRSSNPRR